MFIFVLKLKSGIMTFAKFIKMISTLANDETVEILLGNVVRDVKMDKEVTFSDFSYFELKILCFFY